jgi:oxygen-independent coproporphyrinogen-3 oxidase
VRCTYCAFNTYAGLSDLIPDFVEALCREIEGVAALAPQETTGHTLYFGGGTPSLLSSSQLRRIVKSARRSFALLPDAEITLEANPGTVTLESLQAYRGAGINRLSIGIQSAHQADLKLFGRRHTFEEAEAAFFLARQAGFDNISIDLIYGAPYQTLSGWEQTLDAVLPWKPEHIAMYSLILEPGTSLALQVTRGHIPDPDSDLAADMYDLARDRLAQEGFTHYEISNWAQPGHQSRHNRQYWLNQPYLGFGPGAHGCAISRRYSNVNPVPEYIARLRNGLPQPFPFSPALAESESIDKFTAMDETLFLGLRLLGEGLVKELFYARFDLHIEDRYHKPLKRLLSQGLLIDDGLTLQLPVSAALISNYVFRTLLDV